MVSPLEDMARCFLATRIKVNLDTCPKSALASDDVLLHVLAPGFAEDADGLPQGGVGLDGLQDVGHEEVLAEGVVPQGGLAQAVQGPADLVVVAAPAQGGEFRRLLLSQFLVNLEDRDGARPGISLILPVPPEH